MKQITSIKNEFVKELGKLSDYKEQKRQGKFLIEGYHLIEEALKAGFLEKVLITKEEDAIATVPNIMVTEEIIKKLAKTANPQPILGICHIVDSQEIVGDHILILDGISDPGNMGTIIRTALGFNISTIIISADSCNLYNDKVIRATQGAIFHMNFVIMDPLLVITELKKQGILVIGTSLQASKPLEAITGVLRYALVLGNEARGISKEVANNVDINIKIAINPALESLNVAIAGAIIMHYLQMK